MQRERATKSASAVALFALCAWTWLMPASASAVPKLDIKVFLGVGSTTLVPRVPEFELPSGMVVGGRVAETHGSWQGGLSARVRFPNKAFTEIAMVFSRFAFAIPESSLEICRLQNPNNPETFAEALEAEFGAQCTVEQDHVRFEHPRAHELMTQLLEASPGSVQALTVSKPTLEDVFLKRTGHSLWGTS